MHTLDGYLDMGGPVDAARGAGDPHPAFGTLAQEAAFLKSLTEVLHHYEQQLPEGSLGPAAVQSHLGLLRSPFASAEAY